MRQTLLKVSLVFLGILFSFSFQSAMATEKATKVVPTKVTKPVARATANQKKATSEKAVSKVSQGTRETDDQLEKEGYTATIYQCDLGDKIGIYKKADDTNNLKMRWKAKVYPMSRVQTSTGANRFENKTEGFVLVSIPSKLMLFDSIKGRQLANECRNPEQTRALYNKTHSKK